MQVTKSREDEFCELMGKLSPDDSQLMCYVLEHPELLAEAERAKNAAGYAALISRTRKMLSDTYSRIVLGMNVTYDDAANAFRGIGLQDANNAYDLFEAALKLNPGWGIVGALAVVFCAGRVDGVRRERARRLRKGGASV